MVSWPSSAWQSDPRVPLGWPSCPGRLLSRRAARRRSSWWIAVRAPSAGVGETLLGSSPTWERPPGSWLPSSHGHPPLTACPWVPSPSLVWPLFCFEIQGTVTSKAAAAAVKLACPCFCFILPLPPSVSGEMFADFTVMHTGPCFAHEWSPTMWHLEHHWPAAPGPFGAPPPGHHGPHPRAPRSPPLQGTAFFPEGTVSSLTAAQLCSGWVWLGVHRILPLTQGGTQFPRVASGPAHARGSLLFPAPQHPFGGVHRSSCVCCAVGLVSGLDHCECGL